MPAFLAHVLKFQLLIAKGVVEISQSIYTAETTTKKMVVISQRKFGCKTSRLIIIFFSTIDTVSFETNTFLFQENF